MKGFLRHCDLYAVRLVLYVNVESGQARWRRKKKKKRSWKAW